MTDNSLVFVKHILENIETIEKFSANITKEDTGAHKMVKYLKCGHLCLICMLRKGKKEKVQNTI